MRSTFQIFDRLVRYSNYLKVYRLDDFENLRPAVCLTRAEMRNFTDDPRHPTPGVPVSPFCGLYVFEAD